MAVQIGRANQQEQRRFVWPGATIEVEGETAGKSARDSGTVGTARGTGRQCARIDCQVRFDRSWRLVTCETSDESIPLVWATDDLDRARQGSGVPTFRRELSEAVAHGVEHEARISGSVFLRRGAIPRFTGLSDLNPGTDRVMIHGLESYYLLFRSIR